MSKVIHGDCLEELKKLEDNSVDAVITDPPYGLSNTKPAQVADVLKAWVTGDTEAVPAKKGGFMGKDWDSFVPPPAVWEECMRVLKPGGHMAVFAGARTQDLMGLSIRLAGFEIRDTLGWVYGSGFPKSMDISKAIDKTKKISIHKRCGAPVSTDEKDITPLGDDGESSGYSAACLKCDEDLFPFEIEQVSASEVREVVGSGSAGAGFNPVKGFGSGVTTVGDKVSSQTWDVTAPATDAAKQWDGWGTALKPAIEPIILARKPLDGTVANNVLAHGVGGLNIDACRVEAGDLEELQKNWDRTQSANQGIASTGLAQIDLSDRKPAGRFPANVLLDEHAAKEMDEQSGERPGMKRGVLRRGSTTGRSIGGESAYGTAEPQEVVAGYDDNGGASRFFPVFKYQAKAPKRERPVIVREDGSKIQHPTVKPLALLDWLVTLITPPNGTVLDPFAGSGTTLQAARNKGFNAIGIEQDADYIQLIEERLK